MVTPVIIAACGIGLFLAWKRYKVLPRIRNYLTDPLRHKHVQMVTNVDECLRVVTRLQKDVDKYRVHIEFGVFNKLAKIIAKCVLLIHRYSGSIASG